MITWVRVKGKGKKEGGMGYSMEGGSMPDLIFFAERFLTRKKLVDKCLVKKLLQKDLLSKKKFGQEDFCFERIPVH